MRRHLGIQPLTRRLDRLQSIRLGTRPDLLGLGMCRIEDMLTLGHGRRAPGLLARRSGVLADLVRLRGRLGDLPFGLGIGVSESSRDARVDLAARVRLARGQGTMPMRSRSVSLPAE